MRQSLQILREKLKFDSLMEFLDDRFQLFPDNRASNAQYPLASVVKAAFAMFSLKSPSLLEFKRRTEAEDNNLRTIYRMTGEIPSDARMRGLLDLLEPRFLRSIFASFFELLSETGVIREYRYWKESVIVTVDGVEHFSSKKVNCVNCTTKTFKNGETTYQHSGLAAVIVHPERSAVLPLEFEPILKQDGAEKNDCEQNAAKRLCLTLHETHPELGIILVEDALYANAPHVRQIREYGWDYVLSVKPDSHKSLFRQFEGRRRMGRVTSWSKRDENGTEHRYSWTNDLWLCDSACDVKVNYLAYEQHKKGGEVKKWTWITNLKLSRKTVEKVMKAGRARWKIENETFNTLKNQGYHFEHNYGHGEKHLATVLALLMMLAFLVDQIQQGYNQLFQTVWKGLGAKTKLWRAVRSLFEVLEFETMEEIYYRIAVSYRVRLE